MEERGRNPTLGVKPCGLTRWCGVVDEAQRSNTIMGDLSDTLDQLYAKDGIDYGALTTDEKSSGKQYSYQTLLLSWILTFATSR